MQIKEIINHPILGKLPPDELKAYMLLKTGSKKNTIDAFTIKGLLKDWQIRVYDINMPTSKNKVKDIIRNLEAKQVIKIEGLKLKLLI